MPIDIEFVRNTLRTKSRERAWQLIAERVDLGPLREEVNQYRGLLKRLRLPPAKRDKRYSQVSANERLCRGCGVPNRLHQPGSQVLRDHMRTVRRRYLLLLGHRRKTPAKRIADTQPARDGRRLKFLRAKMALLDPRIVKLHGERSLLEKLDQQYPRRKPKPCELRAGYYRGGRVLPRPSR